jgi:tetraprenyl-beta-curcumene synthase
VRPRGQPAQLTSLCSTHSPERAAAAAPLSLQQLIVVAFAAVRELAWGLPAVASEVRAWRARATGIPDAAIRRDALTALDSKRGHSDGAALFCILPRTRNHELLRLLVAYETVWDFLDSVNERGAAAGQVNGRQLHLALVEALDRSRPISDYYCNHPWREDGSYLRALIGACRESCARMCSYEYVQPLVVREAIRAQVLAINHDLDPASRDRTLREWATREFPDETGADWFELTGAASASLTIHALLALAAKPACSASEIARTVRAYFPWISAATTMLDSYVDQAEDNTNGDHSYIGHYPTPQIATERLRRLIQRSFQEVGALPNGKRHTLLVACMVAMYLSKDSARTHATHETTMSLASAGGPLTRFLLPILRLWRIAQAQCST